LSLINVTIKKKIHIRGMPVEVVKKDIKNLHVGVYPPEGRVRVAAPSHLDDGAIRLAIVSKLGWIKKKQRGFKEQQRQSLREMVTGESHFFQGKRYLLDVIEEEEPPAVRIQDNTTLQLQVRPGSDREKRESVLHEWYREFLKDQIPKVVAEWEPMIGVEVAEARVKRMKTLWGSCNPEARRIWLNLELAKKPPQCLEYIVVHEMMHLHERHHNDRFIALMDEHMPQWRLHRDELNRAPLAHEEWEY
jgi:predicted metal-dependent hydrolase